MSVRPLVHAIAAAQVLLGALLIATVAPSCAGATDAPPPATERDLLARPPDEVFEVLGPLTALPRRQWGDLSLGGWRSRTEWRDTRTPFVQSNQRVAALALPAGLPEDRLMQLLAWRGKPGPRPAGVLTADNWLDVAVRLNGEPVGTLYLTPRPQVFDVETPAELWRPGRNVLELELPPEEPGNETWETIALSRVEYGPARRVQLEPAVSRARFASGTGLRYVLPPTGHESLALTTLTDGPGVLTLRFGFVDGATRELRETGPPRELFLEAASRLERRIPLPYAAGRTLVVDVVWTSPDDSIAVLERLRLTGGVERRLPPVVLITIDNLAARQMSLYGYGRRTTPVIERFARDAVVFEHCVTNAPWALPSQLALHTGLFPAAHRIDFQAGGDREWSFWNLWWIPESRWTLAEALRARGYATAAYVDNDWIQPRYGFRQGFDLFDPAAAAIPKEAPDSGLEYITPRALAWMGSRPEGEVPFAFIQAFDLAGPYVPRGLWRGFFSQGEEDVPMRLESAGGSRYAFGGVPRYIARSVFPAGRIPPVVDANKVVAAYDEELLSVDTLLGHLFDGLRDAGLYDDAIIVLLGDHGESFAHDFFGHGVLYEDVLRVPLIVKLPGNERGGTRVADPVQLVDVYPTLLALVGGGVEPSWLHGRSLVPLLEGDDLPEAPLYSEGGYQEQRAVHWKGWKLIEVSPGERAGPEMLLTNPHTPREWLEANFPGLLGLDRRLLVEGVVQLFARRADFRAKLAELRRLLAGPFHELYDLTADPREERDLARERPDVVEDLRRRLDELEARGEHARWRPRPTPSIGR